jgi:flagellum-specific peptidoglycan hydrolase FlgJ
MDYSSSKKNKMVKNLLLIWLGIALISFKCSAQTTLNYIDENSEHAQELMRTNHIPASIILAVAIHESAAGTSKIARNLNNHFGVKGSNSNKNIKSSYKDYDNAADSYNSFVLFLQNKTAFSRLFNRFDQVNYLGWARGIQKAGYAHSRTWASQVIALIKKYELFRYDEKPRSNQEKSPEYLRALQPVPPFAMKPVSTLE